MGRPIINFNGTQDKSIRKVPVEKLQIAQHTPLFFFFGEKGPTTAELTTINMAQGLYGSDTFTQGSKFDMPSTKFMSKIGANCGSIVCKRLEAPGAKTASFTLCLELTSQKVTPKIRLESGVETTEDGVEVDGYSYNYTIKKTAEAVMQEDGDTKSYPVMTVVASSANEAANKIGVALSVAPAKKFDKAFLAKTGVFPLELSLHQKDLGIVPTLTGDPVKKVSAWLGTIDPVTRKPIDMENTTYGTWFNEEDGEVFVPVAIDEPVFHYDFVQAALTAVAVTEKAAVDTVSVVGWHDVKVDSENVAKLMNMVNFKTSLGKNYLTVVPNTSASPFGDKVTSLSIATPAFLKGGSDGDVSWTTFQDAVDVEMEAYLNTESRVQDLGINFDRVLYDCGYRVPTKEKLANYIALRPDTLVVANTFVHGASEKSLSEDIDVAVLVKNKLELAPESNYFNTPVVRGGIIEGSGLWKENRTLPRISQSIELGMKLAAYTGAANGKWDDDKSINGNPGNVIKLLNSLLPDFVPPGAKDAMWAAGMTWTESVDKRYQWDSIQTVYNNDTSVLNSLTTALAIGTITRAAFRVYKTVTGRKDLTNAQLAKLVVKLMNKELAGAFGSDIVVTHRVEFTAADVAKGSWQLVCNMYDNLLRKEMTHTIEAHRFSDLGA